MDYAQAWQKRPLIRRIYRRYHKMIAAARSCVPGADLEIGAGHGSFAEFRPSTISSDIVPCPWLDCAADAARLPFARESLSNIIMIDVLHHVASPVSFFEEAEASLAEGGRIILLEPYVSPVSWIAWRFFCEENVDTGVDPLTHPRAGAGATVASDPRVGRAVSNPQSVIRNPESSDPRVGREDQGKDPWDANVAIPTLICWRFLSAFHDRFPRLRAIRRERFDMLVMPLSGGFQKRRLIPMPLVPFAGAIERMLAPLTPLLAFRCLVVIEKVASDPHV